MCGRLWSAGVTFLVLILLATTPTVGQDLPDTPTRPAAVTDSVELGRIRGAEAARYESTNTWTMRGFGGGLVLGPIGAGLVWTLANNSEVALAPQQQRLLIQDGGSAFVNSYQQSYAETLHARRKRAAITGGAIGTAALAAIAGSIWAIYYYY